MQVIERIERLTAKYEDEDGDITVDRPIKKGDIAPEEGVIEGDADAVDVEVIQEKTAVSSEDMLNLINGLIDADHALGGGLANEELKRVQEGGKVEFNEHAVEGDSDEDEVIAIDYDAPDSDEEREIKEAEEAVAVKEEADAAAREKAVAEGGEDASDTFGSSSIGGDGGGGVSRSKGKDQDREEIQKLIEARLERREQPTEA